MSPPLHHPTAILLQHPDPDTDANVQFPSDVENLTPAHIAALRCTSDAFLRACRDEDHNLGFQAVRRQVGSREAVDRKYSYFLALNKPRNLMCGYFTLASWWCKSAGCSCRFLAFDRHFNLVLADTEEYRKLPPKKGKTDTEVRDVFHPLKSLATRTSSRLGADRNGRIQREERRVLGLLLLRGDEVVSLTIEGPPPTEELRAQKGQIAPVSLPLPRIHPRTAP